MKNLILTIIATVAMAATADAQTYVGAIDSGDNMRATFAEIAPGEFVWYHSKNDSLILSNTDLSRKHSMQIPSVANSKMQVFYVSRQLFDQDQGIEYIAVYFDTVSHRYSDIKIIDNGSGISLPNMNYNYWQTTSVEVKNTSSASQLIVWQINFDDDSTRATIYDLSGQALSIKEHDLQEVPLAPNPSNDIVKVPSTPGELISVYDINGKLLKQEQGRGMGHALKVTDLPNGNYIIQSSNGGNWKFVKR